MRTILDEKIEEMNLELVKMGAYVEDILKLAVHIFIKNEDNVKEVRKLNDKIVRKEREIEQNCLNILLLQSPVARDLRYVSSCIRIIYDMERIGNQAADLSEIAVYLKKPIENEKIKEMVFTTRRMVVDSIEAFIKSDLMLAQETAKKDDIVDNYYTEIREILIDKMAKSKNEAHEQLDIYMIVKYLERIGDHAENICNWVTYSITGELVE